LCPPSPRAMAAVASAVLQKALEIYETTLTLPVVGRALDLTTAVAATLVRGGSGTQVASGLSKCKRPQKMLKLYEFEGCPFCRKVRETLTVLDLDVIVYPTPRETMKAYAVCKDSRFRPEVKKLGESLKFPFLVDENTNTKMYESDEICKYLWATYGQEAKAPLFYRLALFSCCSTVYTLTLFLASLFRPLPRMGMLRTPSKAPKQPLELWSFEGSPPCRLAREALCSLELPYVLHNIAHGSRAKRADFTTKYGERLSKMRRNLSSVAGEDIVKVPFLIDPNTKTEMFESADIVKYLFDTYATGPTVKETLADYTTAGATDGHHTVKGATTKQD